MPSLSRHLKTAKTLASSRTGVLGIVTVANFGLRMVSSLILTRLLMPEVYGIIGIIMSVFVVIVMLTDLGFQTYVVRHERGDDPYFLDVIWTIHVWRGFFAAAVAIAAAPVVGWAINKPEITWPLAVASLTLAIDALKSFSIISALRTDGSRKLALLDFFLGVAQMLLNIVFALWLRDVWSLVIAMLLAGALRTVLTYTLFPKSSQRIRRDRSISSEFFIFSRVIMASSAITLVVGQFDKLILARLFTLAEFGLYGLAITLATAPIAFADNYVARVLYPVFSAIHRDAPEQIRTVFYASRWRASVLYAVGVGIIIGGAQLIVDILYDPRYHGAGILLSILSLGSALRFPSLALSELMTAFGHVKATLRGNVIRLIWLILLSPVAYLLLGPLGIVSVVALIELPTYAFNLWFSRRYNVLNWRLEIGYFLIVGASALATWACSMLVARFVTF